MKGRREFSDKMISVVIISDNDVTCNEVTAELMENFLLACFNVTCAFLPFLSLSLYK